MAFLHYEKWKAVLNGEEIRHSMTKIRNYLDEFRISEQKKTRMIRSAEKVLYAYRNAGIYEEFEIILKSRNLFPVFQINVPGPAFNPIASNEDERDHFMHLLSALSIRIEEYTRYRYSNRRLCNTFRFYAEIDRKKSRFLDSRIVLCAILGIVLGITSRYLPAGAQDFCLNKVAAPVLKVILGMLSGIMGPVVCLSVISSLIGFNSVSTLHSVGRKIIWKMILITLISIMIPSVLYLAVFDQQWVTASNFDFGALIEMLLGIFPLNLFEPFVENNIIQIVIISGFIGVIMVAADACSGTVADAVLELSTLSIRLMKALTGLTPILILLSTYKMAVSIDMKEVLPVIKILILIYVSGIFIIAFYLLQYKIRTKQSILCLLKQGRAYGWKAFAIGSGTAVINDLFELTRSMKMNHRFSNLYISMSLALTSTGNTIFLVCSAFFMAEITDTSIGITWFITMVILCFELTIATPGGNGGVLVTVTVLLSQLGISQESVGLLAMAQILCANYIAAQGAMVRFVTLAEMNETTSISD